MKKRIVQMAASLLVLFSVTSAHAINYKLKLLDNLGATESGATGINNLGQVSGVIYSRDVSSDSHAVVWSGSTGQIIPSSSSNSVAMGINDSGWVAGINTSSGGVASATMWNGTFELTLPRNNWEKIGNWENNWDNTFDFSTGINNSGKLSGTVFGTDGKFHAVTWSSRQEELTSLNGGSSFAWGLNDRNQTVGYSYTSPGQHAVLWNGYMPTDLGTLGGDNSAAYGINNFGMVVGDSELTTPYKTHATLWVGSSSFDLGALGSFNSTARDINNLGQIVGWSRTADNSADHAVMWNGGGIFDLNHFVSPTESAQGWALIDARGVNDSGTITGTAFNSNTGKYEAYILTVAPVPEPNILYFVIAGLVLLATRRRSFNMTRSLGA